MRDELAVARARLPQPEEEYHFVHSFRLRFLYAPRALSLSLSLSPVYYSTSVCDLSRGGARRDRLCSPPCPNIATDGGLRTSGYFLSGFG